MKRAARGQALAALLQALAALLQALATLLLAFAAFNLVSLAAHAASFDCTRARTKLNRVICSDEALSQFDSTVWTAYGERIKTLTPAQFAHVRERHFLWRRTRGLYETTIEALTHEYRSHLAWLGHPLLAHEGRYERLGWVSAPAMVEVEVDVSATDLLALRGQLSSPLARRWVAAGASARTRVNAHKAQVHPEFIGAPAAEEATCDLRLTFKVDILTIEADGQCGADFGGDYRKVWVGNG